jgi:hypothetical protein
MGTVALGPSYGRVKVAGLTILEAEEAIKRHLAQFIDDPLLQVTLEEKRDTTAPGQEQMVAGATQPQLGVVTRYRDFEEFRQAVSRQYDQVKRERDTLQKENEELKKQIEQLHDARSDTNEGAPEQPLQPSLSDPR